MQDFDAATDEDVKQHERDTHNESDDTRESMRVFARGIAQKLVLFVSFGPGVIGFIWLLARILRR